MKLFLVITENHASYEVFNIDSVYSTEEDANGRIEDLTQDSFYDNVYIVERELDEESY